MGAPHHCYLAHVHQPWRTLAALNQQHILAALRCIGACSSHLGACRAGQVRAFAPSLYNACASAASHVLSPAFATMHASKPTCCHSLNHMHHGHHTLMRDSHDAMLCQQEALTSPCYHYDDVHIEHLVWSIEVSLEPPGTLLSPVSAAACKHAMQSSTSLVPMLPGRDWMESSPKPVDPRKLTRTRLKPKVTRKA